MSPQVQYRAHKSLLPLAPQNLQNHFTVDQFRFYPVTYRSTWISKWSLLVWFFIHNSILGDPGGRAV
jgi:hypothetical protein